MFFQAPWSGVDEDECRYPKWRFAIAVVRSPPRQMAVTAGEKFGPSIADKVSNEDDKGTLDGDLGWFELLKISMWSYQTHVLMTDCVDLVHDCLEGRETCC
jgi:hypothetical protein